MSTRTIAVVFPQWIKTYGDSTNHHSCQLFESISRRFSDISAVLEIPDVGVLLIAARGPSGYFGGEDNVVLRLSNLCASLQEIVGIGIADSRFSALAAAALSHQCNQPYIVDSCHTQHFLDALPVQVLSGTGDVDSEVVDLLQRLGLTVCGKVRALGEAALIDRFGVVGHNIFQLLSGHDVHLFAGDISSTEAVFICESDEPLVAVGHVVSTARQVVAEMLDHVRGLGQQCVRLFIQCETDHGESSSRVWGESRGFTTASVIDRLAYQIDGWLVAPSDDVDAPTSGIVRITFIPVENREHMATQAVLWGGYEENIERATRAISHVLACGDSVSVTVPQWQGGRDVTTAYARIAVDTVDLTDVRAARERVGDNVFVARAWNGLLPAPWPSWVATQPILVAVSDAQNNPIGVTGRHEFTAPAMYLDVNQRRYVVDKVAGPWPVEERWWDPRRARRHVRAQFLVRSNQGGLRVFLVVLENGSWKLIARYD